MNQLSVCPDVSAYRELMRGRTPPNAETLLGHLQLCRQCRRTVQALEDWLVNASAAGAPDSEGRRRARQIALGASWSGKGTGGASGDDSLTPLPVGLLSPAQAPGEIGRLGGYHVLGVLGKGGMGIVFGAEDAGLGRRVALKIMRPEVAAYVSHRERFLREARAMAGVESDHVCPIYQVGEANGIPFIAMPLLRGESLDARLRRERPLPVAEAVRLGREIALGLAAAHEKGIIHRDVKPANVWLEETVSGAPRARLLDFGLARGGSNGRLTRTGEMMGTPAYVAPEQARGHQVDERTDLFSLGVILYEMLVGVRPFSGTDPMSMLASLALDTPEPPASRRAGISAALSDLVLALLEKAPQDRPASASEVAARLAALQTKPGVVVPASSAMADVFGMKTEIRTGAATARRGRGGLVLAAVLGLLLVASGGLAAFALARGKGETPRTSEDVPALNDGKTGRASDEPQGQADAGKEKDSQSDEGELKKKDEEKREKARLAKEEDDRKKARQQQQEASEQAYQQAMTEARKARDAEEWDDALAAYERALTHKAGDPTALAGRQAARNELDRIAQADAEYQNAIQKARAAMKLGQYAQARDAYAEALVAKPNDVTATKGREAAIEEEKKALAKKKEEQRRKEAEALFREGLDAYLGLGKKIDEAEGLKRLRQAAEKGHAVATGWVGWMTYHGQVAKKDVEEGQKVVEDALPGIRDKADEGEADAQALLGMLLLDGLGTPKDDKKAVECFEKAADNAVAAFYLGWVNEYGLGVGKDKGKAVDWYRKAAGKGHPEAMYSLACSYASGWGVKRDDKKAVESFQEAADKGHVWATFRLGEAYATGRGVDKDEKKAVRLFRKAAENDNASAMDWLGYAYAKGRGVEKDEEKAVEWFEKAANRGIPESMYWLGEAYDHGRGVTKDEKKAAEWYRKAARKGEVTAMNNLGAMYANGRGVTRDDKEAVKLFQGAADGGHAVAMRWLGYMYANGRGVSRDVSKAEEWYAKAAARGSEEPRQTRTTYTTVTRQEQVPVTTVPKQQQTYYSTVPKQVPYTYEVDVPVTRQGTRTVTEQVPVTPPR